MKERPILFSGPMINSILDGHKTQTRRVVRFRKSAEQDIREHQSLHDVTSLTKDGITGWFWHDNGGRYNHDQMQRFTEKRYTADKGIRCPYGQIGDRLWVRETWAVEAIKPDGTVLIQYAATPDECVGVVPTTPITLKKPVHGAIGNTDGCFRPSIHMPRWASRLTLEVVGVRVERIQQISDSDIQAEGFEAYDTYIPVGLGEAMMQPDKTITARQQLMDMWDTINEKRGFGWAANPWVWVIEFKVV